MRQIGSAAVVTVASLVLASASHAEPEPRPYPDIGTFRPAASTAVFRVVGETGVWFTTPLGLRCGIDDDGSYGCSGNLPGASGNNEIAWFVGDPFPRLYLTQAEHFRFSSSAGQSILPESTYIAYRGSRCAVARNSAVYCIRGNELDSQIMVTSSTTLRGANALPGA